jgi:hypothetical protein
VDLTHLPRSSNGRYLREADAAALLLGYGGPIADWDRQIAGGLVDLDAPRPPVDRGDSPFNFRRALARNDWLSFRKGALVSVSDAAR